MPLPLLLLLAAQLAALLVVAVRLLPGRRRLPPVAPRPDAPPQPDVSVLVATLDEAARVGPCLDGLVRQGAPMREAIVVDSRSTDGTRALVEEAARRDARIRLETDDPRPAGWMGKVWALEHGLRLAKGEWVLGLDADVEPAPGLVGGVVAAAEAHGFDVVSFSPCFAGQTAGERWLQPAMLVTLVYRVGAAGDGAVPATRVMANGQCFLARREVLERHGGYAPARQSWCDDVTLARHLAHRGARVGFLDGSRLYRVRSYRSMGEAWREWGRSFDLTDASGPARQALDLAVVTLAQGVPLPLLLLALTTDLPAPLVQVNLVLLAIRLMLQVAIRGSYERRGPSWWLSALADPVAVVRLWLSTLRRPRAWRGRTYELATE